MTFEWQKGTVISTFPGLTKNLTFTLNADSGQFQIIFTPDGVTHNFPTSEKAARGLFECLKTSWKGWFDSYVKVNSEKLTDFTIKDYNRLKEENEKLRRFIERKDMALMYDYEERMTKKTPKNKNETVSEVSLEEVMNINKDDEPPTIA